VNDDDVNGDDLAERFRRGEADAVRAVYRRYGGAVHTVARSLVRDPDLATEVVQTTFLKAWRAAATFEGNRDLAPWLYAIARRTAIDALRAEARRPRVTPLEPGREPADPVAEDAFERSWELHQVRQALDDLPPDEREVVRRSHLLGQTHREIADELGIPVGTVKSRSNRAHRRLEAALGHLLPANRDDVRDVLPDEGPAGP
jgi:RNA polymerase sigma-70 factor (ECF subfamily)